ncbi:MAG: hypothetical protein UIM53_00860 [Acutalibacteraceae bacterium]|nr:hypothetical protein [Acutalibacteraceae bacterium]
MVFSKKISAIALVTTMAVGVMMTPMSASAAGLTLTNTPNNTNAGEEIDLSQYDSSSYTVVTNKTLVVNNKDFSSVLVPSNNVTINNSTIQASTTTNKNGRTTLMNTGLNSLLFGTQTKTSTK